MALSGARWVGPAFVAVALLASSPSVAQEVPEPGVEDHVTVQMSVDPVGSVDADGVVTLRGTLTCDWVREDRLTTMVALNVNLRQSDGAAHAAGSLRPALTDDCADYASWEATFTSESEPFRPGVASVETWAWVEYTWPCEDSPDDGPPIECGWGDIVEQDHEVTLSAIEATPPPGVEAPLPVEPPSASEAPTGEADPGVSVTRPTRVDAGGGGTAVQPPRGTR